MPDLLFVSFLLSWIFVRAEELTDSHRSIISLSDGALPRKPCKTCKNLFHSSCLYKVCVIEILKWCFSSDFFGSGLKQVILRHVLYVGLKSCSKIAEVEVEVACHSKYHVAQAFFIHSK